MRVIDCILDNLTIHGFVYDGFRKMSASELKCYVSYYSSQLDKLTGVKRVTFVANNDVQTLALMLASMKSGKTFCPLYQGLSYDKIRLIAGETNASIINFSDQEEYKFSQLFREKIVLDNDLSNFDPYFEDSFAVQQKKYSDEVYIVYTSGTEGNIKGCVIRNDSLLNYCQYICSLVHLSDKDISLVTTSIAFDLAYTAIFPILLAGGSICLFPKDSRIVNDLADYISNNAITVMKTTPSILRMLSKSPKVKELKTLQYIFSGGEPFDFFACKSLNESLDGCTFFNHYGPTEATIGCCVGIVDFQKDYEEAIAVYPIDNVSINIKNSNGQEIECGEEGTLVISGICLGRYLQSPKNQFNDIFYTHDIAHYTNNGGIIIDGRIDNVLKINGFRVNTETVSNYIRNCEFIDDAACVFDYENRLFICFYVSQIEDVDFIKKELTNGLSQYEMPSIFYRCSGLPRTDNGKIETNNLLQHYKMEFRAKNCRELIEVYLGKEYNLMKDKRINDYLSSIEYIELLAVLSDMMLIDFFSTDNYFEIFSDIYNFCMTKSNEKTKNIIMDNSWILLGGGDNGIDGIRFESESLSKILGTIVSKEKNHVLAYTLHSSTPQEYGEILRKIFEQNNCIFDLVSESDINDSKKMADKIETADILYFGGGDYFKLINSLNHLLVQEHTVEKISESKTIIGTCSGAGILCKEFFADAFEHNISAKQRFGFEKGLGLINFSLSMHFSSEPHRTVELFKEMKQKNYVNVLAFEDGASICIRNNSDYELIPVDESSKVYLLSSDNGVIHRKTLSKKGKFI
ncbi:MAG: AMP-binding protein [Catonella sp.]|uniref:AMP-binding protein n=1 Tax=Catonella sp. TaxID=2382125 RepID=UPI003F9EDEBF